MKYYMEVHSRSNTAVMTWRLTGNLLQRSDADHRSPFEVTHVILEKGETAEIALNRVLQNWSSDEDKVYLFEVPIDASQYYPRMARPFHRKINLLAIFPEPHLYTNEIAILKGQLVALTRQLQSICQTIHPDTGTFATYGHEIRNLLILACTEVETHWRAILLANSYETKQFNTNDYVKLRDVLHLHEYAVSFPYYPWMESINPFKEWDADQATKSLPWYAAYNGIKHNRDQEFHKATLLNAFHAISACVIMMWAQFGDAGMPSDVSDFFQLDSRPSWGPLEAYVPLYDKSWTPVPYAF